MRGSKAWCWFDAGWLVLLTAYVLAGVHLVPFHGDESTTIWMSKDFVYTLEGDWSRLRYSDPPVSAEEQHLRLITGSLVKHAMGLAWTVRSGHLSDLNEQWHWGFDWDWNVANGHMPGDGLLLTARWASALMLAASVSVVFGIGGQIGGRPVAYLASSIYALNPVILLDGRRAMFEGGLLLFSLLVVAVGILYARKATWSRALWLGVVAGLAVSAKHSAAFPVMGVFAGIAMLLWQNPLRRKRIMQFVVAGMLAFAVFYVLNPVWWAANPLERAGLVLDTRADMLDGQTAAFGGYDDFSAQTHGFLRESFAPVPQYYEVDGWQIPLADSIRAYEKSLWSGVRLGDSVIVGAAWMALSLIGLGAILRRANAPVRAVILAWAGIIILAAWMLTPLDWQRYYVMVYPVVALMASAGIMTLWCFPWECVNHPHAKDSLPF